MLNRWIVVSAAALFATAGALAQTPVPSKKKEKKETVPANQAPASAPSSAAAATLKVGDKAPELSVEEWIKGKKVEKFESGKIYVVEFWATWCGPCKESIPHLTELQKTYKDKNVTVIGIAGSERGTTEKQKLDGLKNFVKAKADGMNYTVAYDSDRSMSKSWMEPAGKDGIPCAFVVGTDGKIAWIGHPMSGLDKQLKKLTDAAKTTGAVDRPATIRLVSQPEKVAKKEQPAKVDGPTLKIGDRAPALTITDWVQGSPITGFEKGRVYVVEFWATWCGPCKKSIPHLSELQKKYKDKGVTIVGISRKDQTGESVQKVAEFVKDWSDKMQYTVGFDSERTTVDNWSMAANQRGIPHAFIVTQDGTVGWIGNPIWPMGEIDDALETAVAGKLTPEKSRAISDKWKAEQQTKLDLIEESQKAAAENDYKGSIAALDKLFAMDKAAETDFGFMKFELLFLKTKDAAAASAYGNQLVDGAFKNDSEALNQVAWTIVDPANAEIAKKDVKLAIRAAERANELTKDKDPYILDTLAKAYFDDGQVGKAVDVQEKAVKQVKSDDREAGTMQARLEQYTKAKAAK